jgi:heme/copper-type cytochrome/quinol oxidase subunit 4
MKKAFLILFMFMVSVTAIACPVCEKRQPKALKGIAHGSGPDSNWDYVLVWATVFIVVATLYYTIKWCIKPGEYNSNHIKRTVLN